MFIYSCIWLTQKPAQIIIRRVNEKPWIPCVTRDITISVYAVSGDKAAF